MTKCSKLAYSSEKRQKAEEIVLADSKIQSLEIPSLTQMLAEESSVYPFQGTFEEVKNNVAFIAHSSGTTGNFPIG